MPEVGWASLGLVPTLDRGAMRRVGSQLDGTAKRSGRRFGSLFGAALGIGVGAATVGLVKNSIQLEAAYSTTMRQIGVAADVPAKRLEKLDELAQKLGADTIFSSKDAADAMLELAKNGLTPAIIQAGALESALTLAAAGDVPLERAAVTMGNALNAFGLKGKDAAAVAAALAGAANASSASIESLAEGLQQSSTVAADAGLSVQETAAGLAAFANAGISGSDAGTSLKTMLSRLVPQTKKAAKAMDNLGLDFTDAHGEFLPLADIAEQLQEKLSGLSAEERTTALNTIFGSDARRAATVLMNEGRDGIEKYTKATSDQSQADKLAKTRMEGTAGALERMKGAAETAQIQLGRGLAPLVEDVADGLASLVDKGDFEKWGRDVADGIKDVAEEYGPLAGELKNLGEDLLPAIGTAMGVTKDALEVAAPLAADMVGAFNDLPADVKKFLLLMAGGAVVGKKAGVGKLLFGKGGGKGGLLGLASKAKPVPVVIVKDLSGGDLGGGKGKGKGSLLGAAGKGALVAGSAGAVAVGSTVGIHELSQALAPEQTSRGNFGSPSGGPSNVLASEDKDKILNLWGKDSADIASEAGRNFVDDLNESLVNAAREIKYGILPTELRTDIAMNGVPETKREIRNLVTEYGLVPAQKRTLMELAGFDLTLDRIKRINSELDWAARPREARIKITKAYAGAGYDTYGGLQEGTGAGNMRNRGGF